MSSASGAPVDLLIGAEEKEIADGKVLVDAAKAVGVDLFLYSGVPSYSKLSGGKYTHASHVDSPSTQRRCS